ncbi:peroxiredoxin [Kibdelosporangium philippinense]|uniref:thioredoxin-dependent peroxiredoxin n=1 Tax=Kibdelosporangium philippinense TaxID=211113 RepID=A0ABS8ZNY5_9PSEU|nr:peroxiredoxin [Kibdelosporangium philippinense]MCE7008908.1 peroxiredoxin [Kibdelosporangium philippinense]
MAVGDLVEDFELPDSTGTPRRLTEFLEKGPVVLFFYSAAMTRGCTMESCHFRDLAAEFAQYNAQRVGVSGDSVDRQREFSDKHEFDYPLLSDVDGVVAEQLGVRRKIGFGALKNRRMTFVIGVDRKVLAVVHSELDMNGHADRALETLAEAHG